MKRDDDARFWVLNTSGLTRGLCLGMILPGVYPTILSLSGTPYTFSMAISCLMAFSVIGKYILFWSKSDRVFSKLLYALCWGLGIISAVFYILASVSSMKNPDFIVISLLIQGLWMGLLEKLEFILINYVRDAESREKHKMHIRGFSIGGQIAGSLIGFCLNYIQMNISGFPLNFSTIPSLLQIPLSLFIVCLYVSRFEPSDVQKFSKTLNLQSLIQNKDEGASLSSWQKRYETETLRHEVLSMDRPVSELDEQNVPHSGIFTCLLFLMLFSLSYSIKAVMIPALLIENADELSSCKCKESWGVGAIYVAFIFMEILETLGTVFNFYLVQRLNIKWVAVIAVSVTMLSEVLLVTNENITLQNLIIGALFLSAALPFGIIGAKHMLYYMIGRNPSVIFPNIVAALELLGGLFGPFWAIQAYSVKCELCFTFILLCLAAATAFLLFSWKEIVPRHFKQSISHGSPLKVN